MLKFATMLTAAVLLSGCAAMNRITSDVSTYSRWPAERKPGSYAFERLPSQQARPEAQQQLEDAARRALEAAGFTPAVDDKKAEYLVQLGARVSADERSSYPDPFWWRTGLYFGRRGPGPWGGGVGFGFGPAAVSYEREAALLIRDRSGGQPLYEARATHDGSSASITTLLPALFDAAMKDFPHPGVNPRRVTTELVPP